MTAPRQFEKALFAAARELKDPAARDALLDQACEDDPALRARLERLLVSESAASLLFEPVFPSVARSLPVSPVDSANSPNADTRSPPAAGECHIGRYRLKERLGEGGCGVVYLADQQEPVRREVALKIIRQGLDTERVIARFEAECQALALMDHPSIARVLDAGTTASGRPYFVMERVQGVRITRFCDDHRLDLRQRLRLFVRICHAIQHAHQKGVIHRDIKPSNVLVAMQDGTPMPKIIDFGIAKATQGGLGDTTLCTAGELFLGTPAYMSPEQAGGGNDIDTRSDIYSLGVLLHELLTGRPPFEHEQLVREGAESVRRTLREREPAAPSVFISTLPAADLAQICALRGTEPSRLAAALRGDLDCIVLKSLEKDRRRRYETADAVAQEIEHFLADKPIAARPPTLLYQGLKLIRRHRGAFTAATAVLAALVIGLGSSTWLFFREREARREAEQGRANERLLRQQAEARERLVEAASLAGQSRFAEADRLLAQPAFPVATLEGATVFRTLGDWAAGERRWPRAIEHFETLLRIDRLEPSRISTLDHTRFAVALIAQGDATRYDGFRRTIVRQFGTTRDAPAAERTLKNAILLPAPADLLNALEPLAVAVAQAFTPADADPTAAAWGCLSLALFELRRGRDAAALDWSLRSLARGSTPPVRVATAHAMMAISSQHLGRVHDAERWLASCHEIMDGRTENGLEIGDGSRGFWFDWMIARILLREADAICGQPR